MSLDDRNVHALKYNAKIYTKVRDYQLAIKVLDHLLSFDNLNPKLRAELLTVQADIILRSAPLKAIPLIKESYPILFSKRAGDMFRIKQLDRLSLCYLKLGDSIRAKSYLKKAIMFDHNEVSQVALPGVLLRLSRIMINEFQLDSARILAERAFIIHNEIQDRNRISSLRVLYDIYKMQHDSLALDKIKDVYMQELASE